MRSPGLVLVAVASLAGCTETGAHLTLSAPDGPTQAATFRVVLATPDQIPTVRDQRVAPGDASTTTASYFLQRTVAGVESDDLGKVDGFTIRIAPDASISDKQFIPFVLMYNDDGSIVGIGTFRAGESGMPAAILVMPDEIDKYTLTVEKTTQNDDDATELQPGEVRVVTCFADDQSSFASGLVWHTFGGEEYRLLFPDDGSLDATGRDLDMDCDDHEVTPQSSDKDCDDTRNAYHRDAEDVCDGKDTNCDGAKTIETPCTDANIQCANNPFQVSGVRLCDDETKQMTDCRPTATCTCNGTTGAGCRSCVMPMEHSLTNTAGAFHTCQPAIGMLATYQMCTALQPCDVEVVDVRGGWDIEISAPQANAFGSRAYGVSTTLAIRAKRSDPDYEVSGTVGMPLADIDLAFITANGLRYVPVQLRLAEMMNTCSPSPMLTCY